MARTPPSARTTARRIHRPLAIGLAVVIAAVSAAFGHPGQNPPGSSAAPPVQPSSAAPPSKPPSAPSPRAHRWGHRGAPGEADGVVPAGVTVFDDAIPAVADLDPDLLRALRQAATDAADDAADDKVEFYVDNGWRSPQYQKRLLRQAIAEYGSADEAARRVATAVTSPHVEGDAVDIGRSDATAWLSGHGAGYGPCQICRNEPWHCELRPEAIGRGCPRMYANPTQDPRMQQ